MKRPVDRPVVIVANREWLDRLSGLVNELAPAAPLRAFGGKDGVAEALGDIVLPETLLLCFRTGVIVPEAVLERLDGPSYNFHPASPDYPGRDPQHFAVYFGASRYGATAHEMRPLVDSGPIVAVEWFDVAPGTTPAALHERATAAAFGLYGELLPRMLRGEPLPEIGAAWAPRTWTRKDFRDYCRIDASMDPAELERRFRAFDSAGYDNLYTEIGGRTYRVER